MTDAIEHTPGPWEAVLHEDPLWAVRVQGTKFDFVCITTQGNDEANSRLIAEAPMLKQQLAACEAECNRLRKLLQKVVDWCPCCRGDLTLPCDSPGCEERRFALLSKPEAVLEDKP